MLISISKCCTHHHHKHHRNCQHKLLTWHFHILDPNRKAPHSCSHNIQPKKSKMTRVNYRISAGHQTCNRLTHQHEFMSTHVGKTCKYCNTAQNSYRSSKLQPHPTHHWCNHNGRSHLSAVDGYTLAVGCHLPSNRCSLPTSNQHQLTNTLRCFIFSFLKLKNLKSRFRL